MGPKPLPSTIVLVTLSNKSLENGKLKANPIKEPKTEITKYLVKYKLLIFISLIPIAFMTPISRYSSVMVKVIVNLKMTNETMIKQTLRIKVMNARTMFMKYAALMVDLGLFNINVGHFSVKATSTAPTSSVSI